MQTQQNEKFFLENKINILEFALSVLEKESIAILKQKNILDNNFLKIINIINKRKGKLFFTGVGKSKACAIRVASTFSSVGISSVFIDCVDALHGDIGAISENDIVFLISYSGETKEIKDFLLAIKRFGIVSIGVTANKNSFLAENSNFCLNLIPVNEACPNGLAPSSSLAALNSIFDAIAFSCAFLNSFNKEDFNLLHPGGSLGKRTGLKVKDVMRDLNRTPYVFLESTVQDAIEKMTSYKIGAVCIVDKNFKLSGYFSDGDLRRFFSKTNINLNDKIVNFINKYPITIEPERLLDDAVSKMKELGFDNMPVVDSNNILKGIIDERDALIL